MLTVRLFMMVLSAVLVAAQTTTSTSTDSGSEDSAAVKALKDQNTLLDEQIKLATNQQKLAQLYFPAIPARPDSNFTRDGVAALKGGVEAYKKLQQIAREMAARIKGESSGVATFKLSVDEVCGGRSGKDRRRCEEDLGKFNTVAQAKIPSVPPATPPTYSSILIQGQQEAAAILEYQGLMKQLELLDLRIECALDPGSKNCKVQPESAAGGFPAAVAFIGPALQATVDLIKFFRTKTSVSSVSVDPDEAAMAAMLAAELDSKKAGAKIYATRLYPASLAAGGESALIDRLESLRKRLASIQTQIQDGENRKKQQDERAVKPDDLIGAESRSAKYEAEISHLEQLQIASTEAQRAAIKALLDELREKKRLSDVEVQKLAKPVAQAQAESKRLAAAIKQWTDLRDSINTVLNSIADQSGSATAFSEHLRAERLAKLFESDGAAVLQVKVQVAGAELVKTDKAGFTKETGQGGAIASYILYRAKDGIVLSSATVVLGPS